MSEALLSKSPERRQAEALERIAAALERLVSATVGYAPPPPALWPETLTDLQSEVRELLNDGELKPFRRERLRAALVKERGATP